MPDIVILIPARMASTRLPGKPLADIAGEPMIVHVWRRAIEAKLGRVFVATDAPEIAEAVEQRGGAAVLTRAEHASGTDRIHEALQKVDPGRTVDIVVNMQGDLPTLDPASLTAAVAVLVSDAVVDIATLAAEIRKADERDNPNVV
jgi:3-deoxy-manno-octulosonate cytidylyltransferase (CMP-KDO synthetase)